MTVQPITATVPTLRTTRLVLRPFGAGDAEALFALFGNWNVIRMLTTPPWPYTRADAEAFTSHAASGGFGDHLQFAIMLNGRLIGGISSRHVRANIWQRGDGPNFAFWLGEAHWSCGYMTEAADALVRHIFATQKVDAIYCGALIDNLGSRHVQSKLGFVPETHELIKSRPRGQRVPLIGSVLTRTRFNEVEAWRAARRAA